MMSSMMSSKMLVNSHAVLKETVAARSVRRAVVNFCTQTTSFFQNGKQISSERESFPTIALGLQDLRSLCKT